MSYSINSIKTALGLAVLENSKLNKDQKIAMMEFIEKGTDAQISHLALTGEVKRTFTLTEKEKLSEKIKNVKMAEGLKITLQELSKEEMIQQAKEHGEKAVAGAKKLYKAAGEHGQQAMGHVASAAQKAHDFANQHTGGHGTAAAAIAGGAALAGGAAALLARRRAKQKAAAAEKAKKK